MFSFSSAAVADDDVANAPSSFSEKHLHAIESNEMLSEIFAPFDKWTHITFTECH